MMRDWSKISRLPVPTDENRFALNVSRDGRGAALMASSSRILDPAVGETYGNPPRQKV